MFELPKYKDLTITENRENESSCVFFMSEASDDAVDFYKIFAKESGYEQKEARVEDNHQFFAYFNGQDGIYINWFSAVSELYVVHETNTLYFSKELKATDKSVVPQITQVKLEDYGMSYAIRLSDGRFIVIDGGREFFPDAERLYKCLKDGTQEGDPIIACWIMTHPHSDHFHCFLPFMDNYASLVKIESFLLNFPEKDDIAHYPALTAKDSRFEDSSPFTNIPRMYERIEKSGAKVYTAHTGQTYLFGDAKLEILSSMDDTIHKSNNINAISTVIRMELGGQVILWAADAHFSASRLTEKYGKYLKSDILQVPHHGFQGGTAESEIEGYKLILPEVAFLPVSDFNAFTAFCAHKPSTRYLMEYGGLGELITGEEQRTVDLPYFPKIHGKEELESNLKRGIGNCGSRTFVFTGLRTDKESDFEFAFLNMTNGKATVFAELFFENYKQNIRYIKIEVGALAMKNISIAGDSVDSESLYFNWMSLKTKGIPQNQNFAVRFISDIPLVITHKEHSAAYKF